MRSFTTSLGLAVALVAALCVFTPLSQVQAAAGQVQVTIRDEARTPIENATVEVSCNGTTFASLGTTSATGTVIGDPTVGTTCINGSALQFRISSSTFDTQHYPIYGYNLLPFYSSVDPADASSTISGSTNVYTFGVETSSTYSMKVWNAGGDASALPFPTGVADYTFTSSTLAFNWGGAAPGFPGIGTYDWFIQATKVVTLGAGWYEFDAGSDDGIIVTLDGTTVISDYVLQPIQAIPNKKRLYVTAGVHTIDVKYYEHEGVASLYFSFYPIDTPHAPIIDIGTPVHSPLNNRLSPSLGMHSDTIGTVTFGGSCTSTEPISIEIGTSTVTAAHLADGTYSDCTLTVTDPDTDLSSALAIPSFTVAPPVPIHVGNCAALEAIDATSTNYAEDFVLDSDIDCDGISVTPLHWSGNSYIGTFDGNGHTIKNFVMSSFGSYVGLFDRVSGATIKDLNIGPGSINDGFSVGGLVGYALGVTLTNVSSSLDVISDPGLSGTGGLIGQLTLSDGAETTWTNVTVHGSAINGMQYIGGLVGRLTLRNGSTLSVDNAHVAMDLGPGHFFPFVSYAGGLFGSVSIGATSALSITRSSVSSTMDIGSGGTDGGGFIGVLTAGTDGPASLTISHSSSSGSLTGSERLGGFMGNLTTSDGGSAHTIDLSHNQTSMSVTGVTTNLGGFIGYLYNDFSGAVHSTITFDSDSATGNVAGDGNVGGFLGGTDGSGLGTYVHHTRGTGGLIITNSSASGTVTGNLLGDNASNAGGFVGYLSCKSGSASQFSACTLRQNSASGNVTGYRYVGGFMGQMDGDINLEDNYSTGNVTGERDTGGFLGTLNSEFGYANVSRVYASSTVTTSGGSPSNIAGLIGSAQSSNSNTNIDHAFAIASLVDGSGAAHPGWMVGNLSGITPIDLAYSPISGPATACIQSDPSASFCTAHADPTYFYTATNDPLSNWNFSTIWQAHASSSYPTFRFSAVVIDASAPEISFVTAVPETSNAQITWTTNEPASTNIAYSLDSSYGTYTGLSDTFPRTLSHRVLIAGLPPCTTYHFTVTSADRLGSASTSSPSTFTTAGCSGGGSASRGSAGGGGGGGSSSGSGGGGGGGSVRDWITITPVQTLLPTSTPVITANTSTSNQPVTTSESSRDSRSGSNQGSATTGRQCFSYTFTKDLKTGSNSPDVKQLQIFLNRHESPIAASSSGSLSNETTYFGPSTKRALAVFQRAHQLPTDGLFASTTRTFIQNAMPSTTCPVIQVFGRSLKQGMSGVDVRALQRFLKVSETSFFGAATRKALQAFQDARHLPTTGTLDTATRTLLNNLVNT